MRWFLNAGLRSSTPVSQRFKVFLLNRLILVCATINLSIFILDMFLGIYVNGFANLLLISVYYPLFHLQHKGKYGLVRDVFVTLLCGFVIALTLITFHQDRWTEIENIMLGCIAGIIFFYEEQKRLLATILTTLVLFGLKLYKFNYFEVPLDENFLLTLINNLITIIAIYFFMSWLEREFSSNLAKTNQLNVKLKRQKEELEQNELRLKELNDNKNKLFSIVAHDLKKPLNLLYGLVEMSDYNDFTEEERKLHADRLHKNLKSVNHMMDNVLIWAKSQLDGYKVNLQNHAIRTVIEEILALYRETIDEKSLIIDLDISENSEVKADINVLKVALRNFLSNAFKYSHHRGNVRIHAYEENSYIVLAIEDGGIGIGEEVLQKVKSGNPIVSEFGTDGEPGTGLGLALSREMLQLMDANFELKCGPERGTIVTVYIPAAGIRKEVVTP